MWRDINKIIIIIILLLFVFVPEIVGNKPEYSLAVLQLFSVCFWKLEVFGEDYVISKYSPSLQSCNLAVLLFVSSYIQ